MSNKQYKNIYVKTTYILFFIAIVFFINSIRFLRPKIAFNTFTIIFGIYDLHHKTALMGLLNFLITFVFLFVSVFTFKNEKSYIKIENKNIKLNAIVMGLSIIFFIKTVSIFSIFTIIIAFLYYISAKRLNRDKPKNIEIFEEN